jgi:branched-chain amino acid transport system ATP-binding protein
MTATDAATAPSSPEAAEPRGDLLDARGVTKRFAGITALHAVDLQVDPGEFVGLIGPNGAGKTTFFNCLLGILRPDEGTVVFDGRDVTGLPVYQRARAGFGRTFQRLELFAGMTVRDHFIVADRAHRNAGRLWKDLLNRSKPTVDETARAQAMLDLLELNRDADKPAEMLSLGRGRLVELGRALMTRPKLLLLDEPSSGLDVRETAAFSARLRRVQEEHEFAVLLVEHDVDMVQSLVSRLYVLDFGTLIASGRTADVFNDAAVRKAYLGSGG